MLTATSHCRETMFLFRRRDKTKVDNPSSNDLDEETPLLAKQQEGLVGELLTEQQCQQQFVAATACLSVACSVTTLLLMMWASSRQQQEELQDDATTSTSSSYTHPHHHYYSHWSIWMSALTTCLVVSPLVVLSQRKLGQVHAWRLGAELYGRNVEQLSGENLVLQKQVQQSQDAIAPLPALEEALGILQSLGGTSSIHDLQEQLADMERYLRQYNNNTDKKDKNDNENEDYDNSNNQHHKATTELLQALIQVLVSASTTTTASSKRHQHDDSEDDDDTTCDSDSDDYCLLLSDQEMDQLVDDMCRVPNVSVDANVCRKIIVDQGRGVEAIMVLASQVLLYNEDVPPSDDTFFYFVSEQDQEDSTRRRRR